MITIDQNLAINQYINNNYAPVPSNTSYQSFYHQQPSQAHSSCIAVKQLYMDIS